LKKERYKKFGATFFRGSHVLQIHIKILHFYPNAREGGREIGKNSKYGNFSFNSQFINSSPYLDDDVICKCFAGITNIEV
jgi:hypothetical protein